MWYEDDDDDDNNNNNNNNNRQTGCHPRNKGFKDKLNGIRSNI
jgi:hypothetical protein